VLKGRLPVHLTAIGYQGESPYLVNEHWSIDEEEMCHSQGIQLVNRSLTKTDGLGFADTRPWKKETRTYLKQSGRNWTRKVRKSADLHRFQKFAQDRGLISDILSDTIALIWGDMFQQFDASDMVQEIKRQTVCIPCFGINGVKCPWNHGFHLRALWGNSLVMDHHLEIKSHGRRLVDKLEKAMDHVASTLPRSQLTPTTLARHVWNDDELHRAFYEHMFGCIVCRCMWCHEIKDTLSSTL
jgi:hypothetical protein